MHNIQTTHSNKMHSVHICIHRLHKFSNLQDMHYNLNAAIAQIILNVCHNNNNLIYILPFAQVTRYNSVMAFEVK